MPVLSFPDSDAQLLREMVAAYRSRQPVKGGSTPGEPDWSAPDTYLIKLPSGGIDALDLGSNPIVAGSATCGVYGIAEDLTSNDHEIGEALFDLTVLNFGGPIGHACWATATRLRSGRWVLSEAATYGCVYGLTTAAVTAGDTTFSLDNVEAMQGPSPLSDPDSTTEVLTGVKHTVGLPANANAAAVAWFDHTNKVWRGILEVLTTDCEGTGTGTGTG